MIGTFGPITFVVSDEEVKTFEDFNRSEKARWAKHDVIGKKPVPEFLGPDLGTISFKMRFDAMYGVKPRKEVNDLVTLTRDGEYHKLTIGGLAIGVHRWYISDVSQDWKKFDGKGNLLLAIVNVNLVEYTR